jgi:hypothetical protein
MDAGKGIFQRFDECQALGARQSVLRAEQHYVCDHSSSSRRRFGVASHGLRAGLPGGFEPRGFLPLPGGFDPQGFLPLPGGFDPQGFLPLPGGFDPQGFLPPPGFESPGFLPLPAGLAAQGFLGAPEGVPPHGFFPPAVAGFDPHGLRGPRFGVNGLFSPAPRSRPCHSERSRSCQLERLCRSRSEWV